MQSQPDSAMHLLQTIDRHSLSGERLARYAIIYSIAQNKSGTDTRSDSLLRIAFDYYNSHTDDTLYARSQYYMGKYFIMATVRSKARTACAPPPVLPGSAENTTPSTWRSTVCLPASATPMRPLPWSTASRPCRSIPSIALPTS